VAKLFGGGTQRSDSGIGRRRLVRRESVTLIREGNRLLSLADGKQRMTVKIPANILYKIVLVYRNKMLHDASVT
jgi:hypothetical protein